MTPGKYAPEEEMILRACRTHLSPHHAERLSELINLPGLDWDRVVKLAVLHRTVPQLYRHLNVIGTSGIPPGSLQDLRWTNQRFTERSLRQTSDLLRIIRMLDAAGIEALTYKGPLLASLAYGGQVRCFTDLDLLIRKTDRRRALDLFEANGFEQFYSLSEVEQQIRVRYGYEDLLYADGERLRLEIHYDIAPVRYNLGIDTDDLFKRSIKQTLSGMSIATLSHEDLLLFLCWHGSTHYWQPVRQVVDIAELIDAVPALNWVALEARSRRLDLHRAVTIALTLCRDLLETDLPEEAVDRFRPTLAARRATEDFRNGIFSEDPALSILAGYLQEVRAQMSVRDGVSAKCQTAYALAFTPSERDVENDPDGLKNPILTRPMRLLRKYLVRSA